MFDEVVSWQMKDLDLRHALLSDGELDAQDLSLEVASMLREAGPWGQAFPEPLFDNTFRIMEQRLVADKHLKLRLAKEDKLIEGIAFFIDSKEWPNNRCQHVRAVYRLDVNEYKGRQNVQAIIEYLEPAD